MIELNEIEIESVSGGNLFTLVVTIANYVLEFGSGWIDGVNDATK